MAGKVWLVTSGSYSNYQVVVAFTSKELADAYVAQQSVGQKYSDLGVEEYPLLDEAPGPNRLRYYVYIHIEGGAIVSQDEHTYEESSWDADEEKVEETTLPPYSDKPNPRMNVTAYGPDRERVERLAREKAVGIMARG